MTDAKVTPLQETACFRCGAGIWDCYAGGFRVRLDMKLLTKYEELEMQLQGRSTFRLSSNSKETTAKIRLLHEIKNGINGPHALVVSLHDCKKESLNDQIPF